MNTPAYFKSIHMSVNIVTTEDLKVFKEEMLASITELLEKHGRVKLEKWIKSSEVMDRLAISPGTLQNLRNNGTLPYSKLEGILYYDEQLIDEILTSNMRTLKSESHEDSNI